MKLLMRATGLVLGCLMLLLTVDGCRAASAPKRAKRIAVGDSKQQVRRMLGSPTEVTTAGLFNSAETWAYGGWLNWNKLFSQPLRFRLFGPDADEVAIRFDESERVSKVILPK
jgi:outer membrane protein assembly factor BamE (lipoprotein component of BamABCDE complex)